MGANDVGELFRLLLAETGSTQEALGHRIGLSQSEVSAIMRGERTITTVKVISDVVEGLDMPDRAWKQLLVGAFGRLPRLAVAHLASACARAGDAAQDAEIAAGHVSTSGASFVMGELTQLAQRPHLGALHEVLADHGLLAAS